jgi:hypothetical protein
VASNALVRIVVPIGRPLPHIPGAEHIDPPDHQRPIMLTLFKDRRRHRPRFRYIWEVRQFDDVTNFTFLIGISVLRWDDECHFALGGRRLRDGPPYNREKSRVTGIGVAHEG